MTPSTILVTGAAGFIGSQLAARLTANGHHVRVTDLDTPGLGYAERAIPWRQAAEHHTGDLSNPAVADAAVDGCDWVFHLAADHGGVGYLHNHGCDVYAANTRMALNVLDAATDNGARVYYASSACAYPVELQRHGTASVLDETMLGHGTPDGLYGLEKLATLRYAEGLRATGRLDVRVGIHNTVYGPGQTIEGDRTKFPPAVVAKALACRRTGQPLEIWGDGTQVRQNIHIDDCVDKILQVMGDDRYRGPVNITGVEAVTCLEVAELALEFLDVDTPVVCAPGPTGPLERAVSNRQWEATYGPDTQPAFRTRFAEFVAWMERTAG